MMKLLLGLMISYFIGSLPTAYLFGKILKGIDIRSYGSGNIGATNAFRILGKVPGSFVLLIDVLKGIMALTVVCDIFSLHSLLQRILVGIAVVAGHNWTIFSLTSFANVWV